MFYFVHFTNMHDELFKAVAAKSHILMALIAMIRDLRKLVHAMYN